MRRLRASRTCGISNSIVDFTCTTEGLLEVETERVARVQRYKWKYGSQNGAKKGDIAHNMETTSRSMFTDILQVLGCPDAVESHLRKGSIAMSDCPCREILVL